VEEFSIKINLDRSIIRMRDHPLTLDPVQYGLNYEPEYYFKSKETLSGPMILLPQQNVLACSQDTYSMPSGYFGLVQTKGSLARLFVTATANDGQVEPGYRGRITLEMTNLAKFPVSIAPGDTVAQMFVFRCSSDAANPYRGRYQNADGPTLAVFTT